MIEVTAVVCTRGSYDKTFPACLASIVNQTYRPKEIFIYDNNEEEKKLPLFQLELYQSIFRIAQARGIGVQLFSNPTDKSQVGSNNHSIKTATTDFIWRIDDDCVAEPGVLSHLVSLVDFNVGAVGGLVLTPERQMKCPKAASNLMPDFDRYLNIQWFTHDGGPIRVHHLYSTFLYRRSTVEKDGYGEGLSQLGSSEDSELSLLQI